MTKFKGFTLIELLAAIGIIAVLSVVMTVAINPMQRIREARDAVRYGDLAQIHTALELYFARNGVYPCELESDTSKGSTDSPPALGDSWSLDSYIYEALVGQGYLRQLPIDPVNSDQNKYYYEPNCGNQGACTQGTGDYCSSCCEYSLGTNFETDGIDGNVAVFSP